MSREVQDRRSSWRAKAIVALVALGLVGALASGYISDRFFGSRRHIPTLIFGLSLVASLVLLHATLASSTRRINDVLDEQSAGLIALRSEQVNAGV